MAYMSQEKKAKIAAQLKAVMPTGWKYSLAVRHHSTLVLTISAAPLDLPAMYAATCSDEVRASILKSGNCDVNRYHWRDHFEGETAAQMAAIFDALNDGNHDRSEMQSDYFDVGWYVDVQFGRWNKPFIFTGEPGVDQAIATTLRRMDEPRTATVIQFPAVAAPRREESPANFVDLIEGRYAA